VNPDTAPIAEVEAWLAPGLGWTKHPDKPGWYHDGKGMSTHLGVLIGTSMDAAIGCMPPGSTWVCSSTLWTATITCHGEDQYVHVSRTNDPFSARDELLRLAAKVRMKMEDSNEK